MRSNKTILVVDDDVHIRRVIEVKLQWAGYRILTARDGQEAATLVEQHQPDVMITDLSMPTMDGKQLCQLTNRLKERRPFLTIVMTARILPNDSDWIANMRDTIFIEKPFSPKQLLDIVDKYTGEGDAG